MPSSYPTTGGAASFGTLIIRELLLRKLKAGAARAAGLRLLETRNLAPFRYELLEPFGLASEVRARLLGVVGVDVEEAFAGLPVGALPYLIEEVRRASVREG